MQLTIIKAGSGCLIPLSSIVCLQKEIKMATKGKALALLFTMKNDQMCGSANAKRNVMLMIQSQAI